MRQGIKEKDIRDFEKYANKLNDLMHRILEYNPKANIYLADDDLILMSGETHDEYYRPLRENEVTSVYIINSNGGSW